jgi:hypothetical protein
MNLIIFLVNDEFFWGLNDSLAASVVVGNFGVVIEGKKSIVSHGKRSVSFCCVRGLPDDSI